MDSLAKTDEPIRIFDLGSIASQFAICGEEVICNYI